MFIQKKTHLLDILAGGMWKKKDGANWRTTTANLPREEAQHDDDEDLQPENIKPARQI